MTSSKLLFIQYFRAIAILMVVISHFQYAFFQDATSAMGQLGSWGVDVFFFISGFIISYIFLRNPTISAKKFATNRILRIYPTYFQAYILCSLIWIIFRGILKMPVFHRPDFFYDLTLIRFIDVEKPDHKSVIAVVWTLYYEVMFYLVFSLSIFLFKERAKIGIYLFFIWSVLSMKFPVLYNWVGLIPSVNLKFTAGFFMALMIFEKNKFLNFAMIVASISIVYAEGNTAISALIITALATIFCFVLEEKNKMFKSDILFLIGEASYSIYLIHFALLLLIAMLLKPLIPLLTIWFCIPFAIFLVLLAGILNFKYVEAKNKEIFLKIIKPTRLPPCPRPRPTEN